MPLSNIFGNFIRNSVATAAYETFGVFQEALEEDYVEHLYQVSWNPKVKLRRLGKSRFIFVFSVISSFEVSCKRSELR